MGASFWAATILMAAVSHEPAPRPPSSMKTPGVNATRGEVDRLAHAALGIDGLEVMDDEAFGHSIRGANQGLDGLIGLSLLNRGGSGGLPTQTGTTVNSGTAVINAGQAPSADAQRAAQYVFVIRWLMLSTSPESRGGVAGAP